MCALESDIFLFNQHSVSYLLASHVSSVSTGFTYEHSVSYLLASHVSSVSVTYWLHI